MDIDERDRQVVDALVDDGRAGDRDVAAGTDLQPHMVQDRRKRLESEGVIEGYEARIDYDRLGYDVTAVVRFSVNADAHTGPLCRLRADDQLVTLYEVTGTNDLVAIGKFESVSQLRDRIGAWLASDGVTDVSSTIVMETVREHEPFAMSDLEEPTPQSSR